MGCDPREASGQAADALDDARAVGDPVFEAAALAGRALAEVSDGRGAEAVEPAEAALERLTAEQLSTRLPAFWMLGRARRALGAFAPALSLLERGAALAARTGRENVRPQLTVESVATLIELGRIADATAAAEQGLELARLSGNPRVLLWARCALSSARLAGGDISAALDVAGEAAESGAQADFHAAGQPGWSLGAALARRREPRARRGGDARVLRRSRPAGRHPGRSTSRRSRARRRTAGVRRHRRRRAHAQRGSRRLAVGASGDRHRARRGAARAGSVPRTPPPRRPKQGTPHRERRSRALALSSPRAARSPRRGDRRAAVTTLLEAESSFDRFGALRRREEAIRELRRLGHRVRRPAAAAAAAAGRSPT